MVVPAFLVERLPGLRDYWEVHLQVVPAARETSVEAALRGSDLSADVIAQLAMQAARVLALMNEAIHHGAWEPFIEQLRLLGERCAEVGIGIERWYAAIRIFQGRVMPALVEAYATDPSRLSDALAAGSEFIDLLMEIVSTRYFEVRQEGQFHLLVDSVKDYAIYLLDPAGLVTTWNTGAHAIMGYAAEEIIGQSFARFFSRVDREAGKPAHILEVAAATGRFEEEAVRIRKDGSELWADVVVTAIYGEAHRVVGFAKVVRDLSEHQRIAAALESRTRELERANQDLEAFSYSVAHDLRAPLRAMNGFSQALIDDYGAILDRGAVHYLAKIQASAKRMALLIDGLLDLSRLSRGELQRETVDLATLARSVIAQLVMTDPERTMDTSIASDLVAEVDPRLALTLLENLIGNAWKYTGKVAAPRIEIGALDGGQTFFVRDNGAGFDLGHADKLFTPFVRMHSDDEFAGTGIGLATVHRIVERHGGRIWVESVPGQGATFLFTLGSRP